MDNHQLELAESLEEQNLVVHGHIGYADLGLPPPPLLFLTKLTSRVK